MTNTSRKGFFRRAFNRAIDARASEARGMVHTYLSSLDDITLNELGYKRSDLRPGQHGRHFL